MKVEVLSDRIDIDVQHRREGNSAALTVRDENTEVYYGGLHASVTLYDLRIRVVMDPDPGKWNDLAWARNKALSVITSPEVIAATLIPLCEFHRARGRKEGRCELQGQLAKLLGYELPFYTGVT